MSKQVYMYGSVKKTKPLDDFVLFADDVHLKSITSQELAIGDFTDNTNTTGYIDITTKLPALAVPVAWKAVVSAGFTGDTTAVMQVGVSGDLDKFSGVTTNSCLAAGTVGAMALNNVALSSAEQTVRVTVTGASDFGLITAGSMVVTLYYLQM